MNKEIIKKIKNYLNLIRIKHWLKNGLVFLPLFFSANLFDKKLLVNTIYAFVIFSLISSIVYIINDLNDIEKDKEHPIKCKRPIASGNVSKKGATTTILLFAFISFIFMYILHNSINNVFIYTLPIIYLLLNILYSVDLKNIPIIDVAILVSGFVFRVMYGGIATNIEVSRYLYLMIIFGAFFMGFGKRRNEIIKNGDKSRKVLSHYNKDFLDKNMYVALALAVVSYTLWCVDPTTIERIGNNYVFWTIPLLMIILQLYSLNIEGNSYGDPIEVILNDKKLLVAIFIYVIVMGGLLYFV